MDPGDLYTGLYVSGIGILVVFSVLTILVIILSMFKTITYKPKKIETVQRTEEARTRRGEVIREKISGGENTLPIIVSAAIIAFNEYKYSRLKRYELFREFPALTRLLSLVGIGFRGRVKVSIGGREVYVDVEELPNGVYNVRIGGKTYSVRYGV
jgi:hypothetical protein